MEQPVVIKSNKYGLTVCLDNEPDFETNLKSLKLNEEQINEVLKALKNQRDENK